MPYTWKKIARGLKEFFVTGNKETPGVLNVPANLAIVASAAAPGGKNPLKVIEVT